LSNCHSFTKSRCEQRECVYEDKMISLCSSIGWVAVYQAAGPGFEPQHYPMDHGIIYLSICYWRSFFAC